MLSCITLAVECEGIAKDNKWKPLIDSYCKHEAIEDIKQALAGNLCSCGIYPHHIKAIQEAAEEI